jgi:hypothetical protein
MQNQKQIFAIYGQQAKIVVNCSAVTQKITVMLLNMQRRSPNHERERGL